MLGMSGISQISRHLRRDCSSGIWGQRQGQEGATSAQASRKGGAEASAMASAIALARLQDCMH